jgi:3-hydroxy acid dehydrogenase / malonic semialdehyde reductase
MTSIKAKKVLITGASSGIGEACAKAFAKEGCSLVLIARRAERLEELKSILESSYDADVMTMALDVRKREAVTASLKDLSDVDILINNAGLALGMEKAYELNPDFIDRMIDTNIKGLMNITQAITPHMVKRGSGDIINVGSIAGYEVYPGGTMYCASKFAVDAITKGLRMDLVDTPIRVTSIDPGAVNTEFSTVRFEGNKNRADKVYDGFDPLHGEDIADIALFIASRPAHVQIASVVVLATAQAGAQMIHRKK